MPSYTAYQRQVMDADDNITWITMNGNHIPIKEGQTKEEAVKEFLAKKGEGSAKHGSGEYKAKETPAPAKPKKQSTPELTKGQVRLYRDIDDRYVIVDPDGSYTFWKNGEKGGQNRSLNRFEGAISELESIGYKMAHNLNETSKTESAPKEKTNQAQKTIQSDLGKFADAYNKLYQDKDSFEYNPSDLDKEYNKAMHNDKFKEWVQSMVKERGDVFASDRELHALLIVAKEKGLIPQEKKTKAKSKSDSPLVKAVAKALGKSESEAEKEIDGAAQYIKDLMKAKDLRNGDVEETLRGLGVEPDYAEEFLHWATYMKNN